MFGALGWQVTFPLSLSSHYITSEIFLVQSGVLLLSLFFFYLSEHCVVLVWQPDSGDMSYGSQKYHQKAQSPHLSGNLRRCLFLIVRHLNSQYCFHLELGNLRSISKYIKEPERLCLSERF